jgi:hypothetical protein
LLPFNRDGDCLAAKLRPGNVHSAEGWEELLLPEIERQQQTGKEVVFRTDAAFAKPETYEALEEREVKYAIRLPANHNLQRNLTELLTPAGGRSSSNRWSGSRAFYTSGSQLEDVTAGGGEGRVSLWGIVPPAWALSSPTSRERAARWCASTASAARPSNGSRKASRR